MTNRSALMTSYNQQKAAARQAGQATRRVDRAFGIAQAQRAEPRPYTTTLTSCTCPDWEYRGKAKNQPCKHMTALRLTNLAAWQADQAEPITPPEVPQAEEAAKRRERIDQLLADLGY